MVFNTGSTLLEAIVMSVVSKEPDGTYGYKITQDVRQIFDVSETTLYPVLRRLRKKKFFETYDKAIDGRNRRYYRITEKGEEKLEEYRNEWIDYSNEVAKVLLKGDSDGQ
ncbi:MAG: PadR family transcriptional regulator [Eubacterium sp.]|nr:PadR family transcriptional regulator [Eubacterium sp.]